MVKVKRGKKTLWVYKRNDARKRFIKMGGEKYQIYNPTLDKKKRSHVNPLVKKKHTKYAHTGDVKGFRSKYPHI